MHHGCSMRDIREQICELIIACHTDEEIIAIVGCIALQNVAFCRERLSAVGIQWKYQNGRGGPRNSIRLDKAQEIRKYIRLGLSTRKIAELSGVSINTAKRHLTVFKHEGPKCKYDICIYLCAPCGSMRRELQSDGSIKFARGPR